MQILMFARISARSLCVLAVCWRSSSSLRYSDRFLCAAYFVLLHGALTLPIACDSILPTLIHMQWRGILWPGTVNASYSIVLTMLHHRPFWQAVGDNFPVKQIGELATGTTFPLYRELCNIRSHFSLAFVKVPAQDIGRRSSSQEFARRCWDDAYL